MGTVGQPTLVLQGVETPNVSIDPDNFFRYTRRLRFPMKSLTTFAGFGSTDSVQLRQTGVVSKLLVRVTGTVTTAAGTATTWAWPYDLVRAFRVSANGQSNLINASGLQIKLLNILGNPSVNSNGVARLVNAAIAAPNTTNGTLSVAAEDWGTFSATESMGPAVTGLTANAHTVDLYYEIPISFDDKTLVGAIYAQTNATQLTLDIDWESTANLLSAGSITANTLQFQVLGEVFSIPNVGGRYVVPDLSAFHSVIGFRQTGLGAGDNEILLPGTGVGRQLMRLYGQVYSGSPQVPLAINSTNFGQLAWRYGGNDTPEYAPNSRQLRYINNLDYGEDLGANWGFFAWDFATVWAFRDSVDEGATTDLRAVINLVSAPTSGTARMVQETLFAAPVGA